jgi:hypothetical protein
MGERTGERFIRRRMGDEDGRSVSHGGSALRLSCDPLAFGAGLRRNTAMQRPRFNQRRIAKASE